MSDFQDQMDELQGYDPSSLDDDFMGGADVKDAKKTLKRLARYIFKYKIRFWVIVASVIIGFLFMIWGPYIVGQGLTRLFDAVMESYQTGLPFTMDFSVLGDIMLLLLALFIFSAIFRFIGRRLMASLSQQISLDMRQDIAEKLNKLPLKYFDQHQKGQILSRATNDVEVVADTLQDFLIQLLNSVVTIIGALVMMLYISPMLTLVVVILFPLIMLFTSLISKKARKYFTANRQNIGELNGHIEETYSGQLVVKAYNMEESAINKFVIANEKLHKSTVRANFLAGIIPYVVGFINSVGYVIMAVVGAILIIQGRLPLGNMHAFLIYSAIFSDPLAEGSYIFGMMQSTIAASERVFEFLDEEEEVPDTSSPQIISNLQGKLAFNNLKFGYSDDNILMQNINVSLKQGDKVAIVGPTGAGKTTLVNLIMRFYDVLGGSITVDSVDIRDLTKADLRSLFGMVLQDTWLFNGTIAENIAYGKPDATREEVVQAAKAARVDHFIRTLPQGYDTVLDEESTNISQGQKQLLTIARVILKNPEILILDEATSNIDTGTEVEIQKSMANLMQGRTSFVIAHRLSTIRSADMILVMREGDIVEQGSHQELMAQGGVYTALYNSQFDVVE